MANREWIPYEVNDVALRIFANRGISVVEGMRWLEAGDGVGTSRGPARYRRVVHALGADRRRTRRPSDSTGRPRRRALTYGTVLVAPQRQGRCLRG